MTWTPSTPSLPPGSGRPTPTSARSTGSSPPPTPESSSATYTQTLRGDGLLACRPLALGPPTAHKKACRSTASAQPADQAPPPDRSPRCCPGRIPFRTRPDDPCLQGLLDLKGES